jgi:myosin heavy subunit
MKKMIPFIAATIMLVSCEREKPEMAKANPQADSLLKIANQSEETVNEFIASFNEIERNLDSVAVKQRIISMNSEKTGKDLKPDQKARILYQINAINRLMEENTKKIAELNRKLKRSNRSNKHLNETIETLTSQLETKNTELVALNERLTQLDSQVAQLKISVDSLTQESVANTASINDKVTALHTAYYVVGKKKELQEANLIDRKGGLLGIGRTSELSADFDPNKFTKIDYTQTSFIPVNSEAKIITVHPSDSYTLDTDVKHKDHVKNIIITDPEKFWSASKYLVVVK